MHLATGFDSVGGPVESYVCIHNDPAHMVHFNNI